MSHSVHGRKYAELEEERQQQERFQVTSLARKLNVAPDLSALPAVGAGGRRGRRTDLICACTGCGSVGGAQAGEGRCGRQHAQTLRPTTPPLTGSISAAEEAHGARVHCGGRQAGGCCQARTDAGRHRFPQRNTAGAPPVSTAFWSAGSWHPGICCL